MFALNIDLPLFLHSRFLLDCRISNHGNGTTFGPDLPQVPSSSSRYWDTHATETHEIPKSKGRGGDERGLPVNDRRLEAT